MSSAWTRARRTLSDQASGSANGLAACANCTDNRNQPHKADKRATKNGMKEAAEMTLTAGIRSLPQHRTSRWGWPKKMSELVKMDVRQMRPCTLARKDLRIIRRPCAASACHAGCLSGYRRARSCSSSAESDAERNAAAQESNVRRCVSRRTAQVAPVLSVNPLLAASARAKAKGRL